MDLVLFEKTARDEIAKLCAASVAEKTQDDDVSFDSEDEDEDAFEDLQEEIRLLTKTMRTLFGFKEFQYDDLLFHNNDSLVLKSGGKVCKFKLRSKVDEDDRLEARVMHYISGCPDVPSRNLQRFDSMWQNEDLYMIVSHYIEDDLDALSGIQPTDMIVLAIDLFCVLNKLHLRGVIHMDIKPSNCMWSSGCLKLIDFDLSVVLANGETSITLPKPLGTEGFMCPKLPVATYKTDIYSAGVMFASLLSEVDENDVTEDFIRHFQENPTETMSEEMKENVPQAFVDMVVTMLHENPDDRPSAQDCLVNIVQALPSVSP